VDVCRLAWAIAFNLEAGFAPSNGRKPVLRKHRTPETTWEIYWSTVTRREQGATAAGTSLVADLARSVSCEHRSDWQPPGVHIEAQQANDAFHAVRTRYERQVDAFARTLSIHEDDPTAIADEAWSLMFVGYWSTSAKRRFVGDSSISTIVCQICRHLAVNTFRRQQSTVMSVDDERFDEKLAVVASDPDPVDRLAFKQWQRRIWHCMEHVLTPRQRMIGRLVWFKEIRKIDVARKLGTSGANITQILDRATEALRQCLGPDAPGIPILDRHGDDES
jgi:RNA polymerase sigma factor (sigma-70 family)